MEAKRKQLRESEKNIKKLRGLLELPLQYVFGYGVKPLRVFGWWFAVVFICAFIYAFGNGILPVEYTYFSILTAATPGYGAILFNYIYWFGNQFEKTIHLWGYLWKCIYFSTVSAATPGYGGYAPRPGFEVLAAFEAVFGTFMWAAFIATFARKYMRA